jgi:hypothetical protein
MEDDRMSKNQEDWGDDIKPYDEYEDIRHRRRGRDEWDETEDDMELSDPNLDPGFSSWNDYYRYMYG